MPRTFRSLFCLASLCLLPTTLATASPAGQPTLVADLVLEPSRPGTQFVGMNPEGFVELGERTFFRGWDQLHGGELWVSDGIEDVTAIFLDLCSGPCTSSPGPMVAVGNRLFFFADDGVSGRELWVSDGTRQGTHMVGDLCQGPCGWYSIEALQLGSRLVFLGQSAVNKANRMALWASDGTLKGTARIALFQVAHPDDDPPLMTSNGTDILFGNADGELWASDGTADGTRLLEQLPGPGGLHGWVTIDGTSFFNRQASLWSTNATAGNATRLVDLKTALGASAVNRVAAVHLLAQLDSEFFFLASRVGLCTLWRSDGTPGGTLRVAELRTNSNLRCPRQLVANQGRLYFEMITDDAGEELWTSDGTAAGTRMVIETAAGRAGSIQDIARLGDHVYFATSSSIWRTDGMARATSSIFDVGDAALLPGLAKLDNTHGRIAFGVWSEDWRQANLLLIDQTGAVSPIARYPTIFASSFPQAVATPAGGPSLLIADRDGRRRLWATGGVPFGLEQLTVGNEIGDGAKVVPFGDAFAVASAKLLVTDGTRAGTHTVADVAANDILAKGDLLFLSAGELWRSDGTEAGTFMVRDIFPGDNCCVTPPGPNESHPNDLTEISDRVVFSASSESGRELWTSDGTESGTELLADIRSGPQSSNPRQLRRLHDGQVVFSAYTDKFGRELWRTDGTTLGTRLLIDLAPGSESSNPTGFRLVEAGLYFLTGNTAGEPTKLWFTGGASPSTILVSDLAQSGIRQVDRLVEVGGRLFFAATASGLGRELWTSDGTPEGTHLVTDIFPGAASSSPAALTPQGNRVLFAANDGVHGVELWTSGGTSEDTYRITDLNPGAASASPSAITATGTRIVFAAANHVVGFEVWTLPVPSLFADGFESGDLEAWRDAGNVSVGFRVKVLGST